MLRLKSTSSRDPRARTLPELITHVGTAAAITPLTSPHAECECFPRGGQGDWRALHSDGYCLSCSYIT
jgi:hypothetical protein